MNTTLLNNLEYLIKNNLLNKKFIKCCFCKEKFSINDYTSWVLKEKMKCYKCKVEYCTFPESSSERTLKFLQDSYFESLLLNLPKSEVNKRLLKFRKESEKYLMNLLNSILRKKKVELKYEEKREIVLESFSLIFKKILNNEIFFIKSFGSFYKFKLLQALYSSKVLFNNKQIDFEFKRDEKIRKFLEEISFKVESNNYNNIIFDLKNSLHQCIEFLNGYKNKYKVLWLLKVLIENPKKFLMTNTFYEEKYIALFLFEKFIYQSLRN